jgi:hypothetical protein
MKKCHGTIPVARKGAWIMKTQWASDTLRRAGDAVMAFALLFTGAIVLSGCMGGQPSTNAIETRPIAVAPPWAPAYEDGLAVRYYYLPDYEVYYDVWDHEFAYLDEGRWVFTRELPGPYAAIDLSSAFVVVLNDRVYEPWMHHQYYVAHYPRYYYMSVYGDREGRQLRGFNENGARPLRIIGAVRTQMHAPAQVQPSHAFPELPVAHVSAPGQGDLRKPGDERTPGAVGSAAPPPHPIAPPPADHAGHPPRSPQPVHYDGGNVGKPVKVEPHMTRPKDGDKSRPASKEKER